MNAKLAVFGKIGLAIAKGIFPAIEQVETAITALKGKDKQQAAVDLILGGLQLEQQIVGKDVLSEAAGKKLRLAIDAQVAFLNQVKADRAATTAAAASAPTPGGE